MNLPSETEHPEFVGPYQIIEPVGEGGMAVVYLARQTAPVARQVAVKLIKLGMDTREVVARFESERQMLATLDHPNIATVFDAGATDTGRPYFAMEFVRGHAITEYCDRNRLDVNARLRLFLDVCGAVQHAHHKGIIHRDLKPSNIMVEAKDRRPLVKVIDFGIAKVVNSIGGPSSVLTRASEILGTPTYMSPEQAENSLDIDTRSDVFSLGVVLYHLLAGVLPLDLRGVSREVALRSLLHREPPTPSRRYSSLSDGQDQIASARDTDAARLERTLRGDLDWVVMRAMAKDRVQRYSTANALGDDLTRYLDRRPVEARPPSLWYSARRFAGRRKTAVTAAIICAVAILAGGALALAGMIEARRASEAARLEADSASQVTDLLVEILGSTDPGELRGDELTARQLLDRGYERVLDELDDQPLVHARLLDVVGRVYRSWGVYERAQQALLEAVQLRRDSEAADDLARSLVNLGNLEFRLGDQQRALEVYSEALSILEADADTDPLRIAKVLHGMANSQSALGEHDVAAELLNRSLQIREAELGAGHAVVADSLNSLGAIHYYRGDLQKARAAWNNALAIREAELGRDHPSLAQTLNNLAVTYVAREEYADALPILTRAVAIQRKVLGPDHPDLATALNNVGEVHYFQGDYATAKTQFEQALAILENATGREHPDFARSLGNLGKAHREVGDFETARRLLEEAQGIRESVLQSPHFDIGYGKFELALLHRQTGDYPRARATIEAAIAMLEEATPGHWLLSKMEDELALIQSLESNDDAASTATLDAARQKTPAQFP